MKVQLRRWVTVGLMSGSLAISALVGTAAVGASSPADSTVMPRNNTFRELRDNVDGTFHNARLAAVADRPKRTAPDLRRRMGFGLRCAYAHGVSAIRTHPLPACLAARSAASALRKAI